jgi:hypothetical protein
MSLDAFFGNDPWSNAVELVRKGTIGSTRAAAVQAVCPKGAAEKAAQEWRSKMDAVFGTPVESDTITGGSAVSVLLKYDGPVIVRLFVDEGPGQPVANFELVGTGGLLVWKPERYPLSVFYTHGGARVDCEDANAESLERMAEA